MRIDIIGAPMNLGCDRAGPESGPDAIRRCGLAETVRRHGHTVCDRGDLQVGTPENNEKFVAAKNMKYMHEVADFCTALAETVHSSISEGAFPIILGGDHSVGLGSGSGASESDKDFGIVWFDAHGDINTAETSPSGNLHGMILASLMGEGDKELAGLYRPCRKVDPKNVFLIGVRSLDQGEVELIERERIRVYGMGEIHERGMETVAKELVATLDSRGIKRVHLSIDIDGIDPAYAPGTGTRVDNGVRPQECFTLIDAITGTGKVCSMDMVELNPLLDDGNRTQKLCVGLIGRVVKNL